MKLPKITLGHVIVFMLIIVISAGLTPYHVIFEVICWIGFGIFILYFLWLFCVHLFAKEDDHG